MSIDEQKFVIENPPIWLTLLASGHLCASTLCLYAGFHLTEKAHIEYGNSFYFVMILVSTIGLGNLASCDTII